MIIIYKMPWKDVSLHENMFRTSLSLFNFPGEVTTVCCMHAECKDVLVKKEMICPKFIIKNYPNGSKQGSKSDLGLPGTTINFEETAPLSVLTTRIVHI